MPDAFFTCFCRDKEVKFLSDVYAAFQSEFALAFILQAAIILTATMYSQFFISFLLLCGKAGIGLAIFFAIVIHLISNVCYVYLNGRNDFNGYSARVISDILSRSCAFMWVSAIDSVFSTPYYGNSTDSGAIAYSRTGTAVTFVLFLSMIFVSSALETYVYMNFNAVADVVGKLFRINPAVLHSIKKNFSALMPLFSPIVFCIPVGYSFLVLIYSLLWKDEAVTTTQRSNIEQLSLIIYAVIVTIIAANTASSSIGTKSYTNLAHVLDSASSLREVEWTDDSAVVSRITISDFHRGESTSPEYKGRMSAFRRGTLGSKPPNLSSSLLDEGSIENDFVGDTLFGKSAEQNQSPLGSFGIKARFLSALQQVMTEVEYAMVAYGWLYATQFSFTIEYNQSSNVAVEDVIFVFINAFVIFWFTRRIATQYIMTVRLACSITHMYEDIGYINYCIVMERVMVFVAGVHVSNIFSSIIMADISGYSFPPWLKLILTLLISVVSTVFVLRSEKSFLSNQLVLRERTTEIVEELFDTIRAKYGAENSSFSSSNIPSLSSDTPFSSSASVISSEAPTVIKSQPASSPFHHSTTSSTNDKTANNQSSNYKDSPEPLTVADFYGRWVRQGVFAMWRDPLLLLQSVCCPCHVLSEAEYVSLDGSREASPGLCGISRRVQVRAVFVLSWAMSICFVVSIAASVQVYVLLPVSLLVLLAMIYRARVNIRRRFVIPVSPPPYYFMLGLYSFYLPFVCMFVCSFVLSFVAGYAEQRPLHDADVFTAGAGPDQEPVVLQQGAGEKARIV